MQACNKAVPVHLNIDNLIGAHQAISCAGPT
jgi:hypothetical protein